MDEKAFSLLSQGVLGDYTGRPSNPFYLRNGPKKEVVRNKKNRQSQ
jgi:hypothetical protein